MNRKEIERMARELDHLSMTEMESYLATERRLRREAEARCQEHWVARNESEAKLAKALAVVEAAEEENRIEYGPRLRAALEAWRKG